MRNLARWIVCLAVVVFGWTAPARAQNDPESRRAAIDAIYPIMINALETKSFGRARNICDQVIMWEPQNPVHHYNLACIEAQAGGARIPYAWGALELAIALGFNDAEHLQRDPDLAPLRSDPKFADLVRKITFNVTAGETVASVAVPEKAKSAQETASVVEWPASAGFQSDLPVGLYLMSRYRSSNQTFEQSVWYFAPDGTVYENLQQGFSQADLATHVVRRGHGKRHDRVLEISWADGTNSKSDLERDGSDFTWDLGIFSPVSPFQDPSEVAGIYEGDAPPDPGAVRSRTQRLELQRDGTFRWSGGLFVESRKTSAEAAPQNKEIAGKWELSGLSLLLTRTPEGNMMRTLAFPDDDIKTVVKPDRMFFGGSMLKRRP